MSVKNILEIARDAIGSVNSNEELKNLRAKLIGKSGMLTLEFKKLGEISDDEKKKEGGILLNKIKCEIDSLLDAKYSQIKEKEILEQMTKKKIDLTIPVGKNIGKIHLITKCIKELVDIFAKYNMHVKSGPEIENEWYNFTALNIGENHPARQMHDTFYLKNGDLLRTHTSSVQIREMKRLKPPFHFISPGKVYRSDSDATHTPMFHQIEGIAVGHEINMGNLKYIVMNFLKTFFEDDDLQIRFRPSFFPFTEPSAEVDVYMKKSDKWLELMGCGMVHPNVLKNVGIDHTKYTGFAFGAGVERLAMIKYDASDLRQFFESDIRWLSNYGFFC